MPTGIYNRKLAKFNSGIFQKSNHPKSEFKKGEYARDKHPNWKGGEYKNSQGYWLILKPEHPRADKWGYILRSHSVVEKRIGRLLNKREIVHHINRIKDDDRIENLYLFFSNSKHRNYEMNLKNTYLKWIRE